MTAARPLDFKRYDPQSASEIFTSVVGPLYVATHADVAGSEFYGAERFIKRLHNHARAPGFELVVVSLDDQVIGQSYGYTLQENARWWKFLTTEVDESLTKEDGFRTFALCELMVHPEFQGHGVAHRLHDNILSARPESRATLLVREDNTTARDAYAKWGWRKIGKLQPFPDSPNFDALILDLHTLKIPRR
jgi:ribosomal protein S18 acetylase RimI-like enzyme